MAMIKCRECGEQVSSNAKKCPHCGIAYPSRVSNKLRSLTQLIIGVPIVFIIVKACVSEHDLPITNSPAVPAIEDAAWECRSALKLSLHDPDSAEIGLPDEFIKQPIGKNSFKITIPLRARNGFNALRKITAVCIIKRLDNGRWHIDNIKTLQ